MPNDDSDLIKAWQMGDAAYHGNILQEQANYQQARAASDAEGMASAGMKIANYQQQRQQFANISIRELEVADPQKAAGLKISNAVDGLTPDEIEIAKNCRQTPQEYAANKLKLRAMRERGDYRDDHGSMKR
jgi:hypothetical protein